MNDDLLERLQDHTRRYDDQITDKLDAVDRIEELEAKLAKAVEALSTLADCVDDGCFCSEMEMATAMDKARTTLAELKGEK